MTLGMIAGEGDFDVISLSTAIRRPKSRSGSLCLEVAGTDCWRSCSVGRDSSYVRCSLPVVKSKIRINLSGWENIAKLSPVGLIVREMGTDLAFLKSKRLVVDLREKTCGGFS